jgi:hypothetical protein
MSKKSKCEECSCIDTKDNPILEELDPSGYVIKKICMMCYAESLDENTNTNY